MWDFVKEYSITLGASFIKYFDNMSNIYFKIFSFVHVHKVMLMLTRSQNNNHPTFVNGTTFLHL